ncbi:RidA family protein [Spongiimicrobium sp. 3-5]|uniref:RidA family protein n=1 Tax=Spongiimicrobium sp. 3-5 TaxID=3332596 RepID=UPI00397F1089
MITERLKALGYTYEPADLKVLDFHQAVRTGNLIFTSGQTSVLGDMVIKGKVGEDVDVDTAYKAAEICAFKCLKAVGAIADVNDIVKVVKVFGMVNTGKDFNNTSGVINGATHFLNKIFGDSESHARSAVGMVIPGNWAVEVEMVVEMKQ